MTRGMRPVLRAWKIILGIIAPWLGLHTAGLCLAMRTKMPVGFHHVYSHGGHPWNELADCVCSNAADGLYLFVAPPPPLRHWAASGDTHAEWAFLQSCAADVAWQYLPVCGNSLRMSVGFAGGEAVFVFAVR